MPSGEMSRKRKGKVEYAQVSTGFLLFAQRFSQPDFLPVGPNGYVCNMVSYFYFFFTDLICSREYEFHVHTIHNLPLWLGIVRRPLHTHENNCRFFLIVIVVLCIICLPPYSSPGGGGWSNQTSTLHTHTHTHTHTYIHSYTHTYIHTVGMMMMMMMI